MPIAYAIILAGGAGTRLWPLSRQQRPKQLIHLFEGRSLLQHAVDRLEGLFEPQHIRIVTTDDLADAVAAELPGLPPEGVVREPALRDTANAIGLAAHLIARDDPDAIMCVFTADHLIRPRDAFQSTVRRAIEAADAHADALITFGIKPTMPHTGYGYLELGEAVGDGLFVAAAFREKPDADTARKYLAGGNHLWNSGMFVWRISAILTELRRCLPENHQALDAMAADWGSGTAAGEIQDRYASLHRVSIDYGVMEKAQRVLVVPMDCDWIDVGSWEAIAALHAADASNNVAVGARSIALDAGRNVVVSEDEHLIVTVGVDNLIVVRTPDATLVCRRDEAQRVREIVERCRADYGNQYL